MSFSPLNIGSQASRGTVEKSEEFRGGSEGTMTVVEDWKTPEYSVPGNARKREENVGIRAIFHPLTERWTLGKKRFLEFTGTHFP